MTGFMAAATWTGSMPAVVLTRAGLGLAKKIHAEIREALSQLTDRLDPAEREKVTALLTRMLPLR